MRTAQAAHETRFQAVVQHLTATILTRVAERTLAHLTRAFARKEVLSQIEAAVDATFLYRRAKNIYDGVNESVCSNQR